jgi:hypothetical protein
MTYQERMNKIELDLDVWKNKNQMLDPLLTKLDEVLREFQLHKESNENILHILVDMNKRITEVITWVKKLHGYKTK